MALAAYRLNHNRTVQTGLLLEARMAVIPIGARVLEPKLLGEACASINSREAQSRHAVHICRQDQAVPMDRCRHRQAIGNPQRDDIAFSKA